MKTLFLGVVLIVLIGFAGFFYRNVTEHAATPQHIACTMEAKVCPDGSSVGRVGPACEFAACPTEAAGAQNVTDAEHHISYIIPEGYVADEHAYGADETLIGAFVNDTTITSASIVVRDYPIPAGKTGDQTMIDHTTFATSDMKATSTTQFGTALIGGKSFRTVTLERFEGVVTTAYYLERASDVLRFEATDKNVMDWTSPSLEANKLPAHAALLSLLGSLKLSN